MIKSGLVWLSIMSDSKMTQEEVKGFLVFLLEKKQRLPEDINVGSYRYLELGHIDSLSVMNFILNIEDQFNIEISDEDMLSELFQTVDGLVEIIMNKY